jgi:hypothetical protein
MQYRPGEKGLAMQTPHFSDEEMASLDQRIQHRLTILLFFNLKVQPSKLFAYPCAQSFGRRFLCGKTSGQTGSGIFSIHTKGFLFWGEDFGQKSLSMPID